MNKIICSLIGLLFIVSCKKDDDPVVNNDPQNNNTPTPADTHYSALTIHISTFRNNNGQLAGALFNSSAGYSSASPYRTTVLPVTGTDLTFTYDSVPSGEYGFSCFHDEDSNNTLNTNLGFPSEGFGFSNNPAITFGAPSWGAIRFTVSNGDSAFVNINLIYF